MSEYQKSIFDSPSPSLNLQRPLSVFGKAFKVSYSSKLSLCPETVCRAAIGKSIVTLLKENEVYQPFRQLRYGLQGRHKLSETSKNNIRQLFGCLGDKVVTILNGAPIPKEFLEPSLWEIVSFTWNTENPENTLDLVASSFIELEKFATSVQVLAADGEAQKAKTLIEKRFGKLDDWSNFHFDTFAECILLIESSLHVIVNLEIFSGFSLQDCSPTESLLKLGTKPLGNWLRQVAKEVDCDNYKELADFLLRSNIDSNHKFISHDTLKGWSSIKKGMLMPLDACNLLLRILPPGKVQENLLSRFALARFLTFLCDLLRSCVQPGTINWNNAQELIYKRYSAVAALKMKTSH
ncbi:hypothetical protein [Comamonas sp. MYb69]|uniref:hypothetical protein n=1 Tax=Comamonas sp. MYb69 TaxID=1848650 RepID=UPI00309885AF